MNNNINLDIFAIKAHITNPVIVGIKNETTVHFQLLVSFLMVRQVVEHGKCINENNITHMAVIHVHPLFINSVFNSTKLLNSLIAPVCIYAIIIIGITISLAGNPSKKAIRMTPSNPNI